LKIAKGRSANPTTFHILGFRFLFFDCGTGIYNISQYYVCVANSYGWLLAVFNLHSFKYLNLLTPVLCYLSKFLQ